MYIGQPPGAEESKSSKRQATVIEALILLRYLIGGLQGLCGLAFCVLLLLYPRWPLLIVGGIFVIGLVLQLAIFLAIRVIGGKEAAQTYQELVAQEKGPP